MLKIIINNTLAQIIAKFVAAGLTLLTTYFTIQIAGLEVYGDLTKIIVIVAVGFTVIDFGINAAVIRSSKTTQELIKNLPTVIYARLGLSLLTIVILNLFVQFLQGGYTPQIKNILALVSFSIIFQSIYTSGNVYFQYTLSYWRSTLSVIAAAVVTTLTTIYFLYTSPTLFNLALSFLFGYITLGATTLLLLPKLSLDSSTTVSQIFLRLKQSVFLGAILIASVFASKIDTIILGVFRSSNEVGQYGFAYRIFDVILVLPAFVMNALYPLLLKNSKLLSHTLKSLGLLGILAGFFTFILSPSLLLIKPELTLAVSALKLLSLSLPFFYLSAPLMWHLITQKKDKHLLLIYLVAALLNTLFNYLTIPKYGILAAAIITGLTELFLFVTLLYFTLHEQKITFAGRRRLTR